MPQPGLVILDHAGERFGAVGDADGHADDAAGKHIADARQNRVHDGGGVRGRQHRPIDLGGSRKGVELAAELGGHGVERGGQLLELIPAGHGDPAGKVALGNPAGALLQLLERQDAPADLAHAEQQYHQAGQPHDQEEGVGELHHRLQHLLLGLGEHHSPGLGGKGLGHSDLGRSRQVGLVRRIGHHARVLGPVPSGGEGQRFGRAEDDVRGVVHHRHAGGRRRHALVERAPEILGAGLSHERAPHLVATDQPAQQVDPGRLARRVLGHDQREAQPQIGAVARRQLGPPGKTAEDLDALAIVANELDGDESLAREQIQPRDQGLTRCDQLGA